MAATDDRITILQLFKAYKGSFPLHNEMVRLDPHRFRSIVCYLGGRADGNNALESLAARTEYLGYSSDRLRWHNRTLLRRIQSLIDQERVRVVNCHLHRTTPVGVLAARLSASRPVVLSTVHGLVSRTSLWQRMQNRVWRKGLYRFVAVSDAVGRSLVQANPGLDPAMIVTVHNGLDLGPFQPAAGGEKDSLRRQLFPAATGDFWFGTAGRLSAVKNHATLLQAFRKVQEQFPGCRLLVAGKGELEERLKALSASLGIEKSVAFLGYRSDLPRVYQTLDGFVFPSLREGLPLALVEAMASGLPVVASRVGGIPEVVGADEPGSLVPAGDVDALAAAMVELVQLPADRRQALGLRMRQRAVEGFQADRMIRSYENLYADCYRAWLNGKR